LTLSGSDGERRVMVSGSAPEDAKTRATSEDEVRTLLSKTGGTVYNARDIRIDIVGNLSVRASAINAMRREALDSLSEERTKISPKSFSMPRLLEKETKASRVQKLSISVDKLSQLPENVLDARPDMIYAPIEELTRERALLEKLIKTQNIALKLPRVYFDTEKAKIEELLDEAKRMGVGSILVGNIGQLPSVLERGFLARADFSINAFNSYTLKALSELGFSSVTLSEELTLSEIARLYKPVSTELIIYGRTELMITETCIGGGDRNCKKCLLPMTITDRRGEKFHIRREFGCRNTVLNGHTLYLLDKKDDIIKSGADTVRLSFTTEDRADVARVFEEYTGTRDAIPPRDFTRALYYKGVM